MWPKQQSSFNIPKQGSFSYNYSHSIITGKPNTTFSQPKRSSQPFTQREMVPWGVSRDQSTFETSYSSNYRDNSASKVMQRVTPEPIYPSENLSSTFIPCGTPKFTRGKKFLEPNIISGMDVVEAPRSGRKRFDEIKHKADYTKDTSRESYREFDGCLARSRTPSPDKPRVASIIKNVLLHHSQVKENFQTEASDNSCFDHSLSLFSKTVDENRTAGCSDFRKFVKPPRTGRMHSTPKLDTNMQEFMSNSYIDPDHKARTRTEILSQQSKPIKALQLRDSGFVNRYENKFDDHRRSVSPTYIRENSPLSRSFYQDRSFSKTFNNRSQTPEISGRLHFETQVNTARSKSPVMNEEPKSSARRKESSPAIVPRLALKKSQNYQDDLSTTGCSGSKSSRLSSTKTKQPSFGSETARKKGDNENRKVVEVKKSQNKGLSARDKKETKTTNKIGASKISLESVRRLSQPKQVKFSSRTKNI